MPKEDVFFLFPCYSVYIRLTPNKQLYKEKAIMKKCIIISGICALGLLICSCSNPTAGTTDTSSVDDKAATTLAPSGGTPPTSEKTAATLYEDANQALNLMVSQKMSAAKTNVRSAARKDMTIETDVPISASYTDETGGTLDYTGSYKLNTTLASTGTLEAGKTYAPYMTTTEIGTVNGTLNKITVTKDTYTYTISGTVKNTLDMSMKMNMTTGTDPDTYAKDATFTMDLVLKLDVETALSIKRSDGVGAKYVISYSANYQENGMSTTSSSYGTALSNYLAKQTATLKVYNDSNKLVLTTTLTGAEVFSTSVLGSMNGTQSTASSTTPTTSD
jgi:hypothetical protein